jgi:hypothetical protein
MAGRDSRLRENQELFRTGNERIGDMARGSGADGVAIPFLCECAADTCLGRIELTFREYEGLRSESNQFVILPGHATIEGERVLEEVDGRFQIVRKEAP